MRIGLVCEYLNKVHEDNAATTHDIVLFHSLAFQGYLHRYQIDGRLSRKMAMVCIQKHYFQYQCNEQESRCV